jgi:hypothetical protein
MRLSRWTLLLAPLAVSIGCSSVPSYEGGPEKGDPYGIVQPEGEVKLWAVDAKPAFNKDTETYSSPGNHTFRFRIDYPMDSDEIHPFEYIDLAINVVEGHRYRVGIKGGDYEKGPPYSLDVLRETKIAGYGK